MSPEAKETPTAPAPAAETAVRRTKKTGTVVSTKMQKTVVVEVTRTVRHGRYGRYVKRTRRLLADDRVLGAKLGDVVLIEETRPLSARKRWRVTSILTSSAKAS